MEGVDWSFEGGIHYDEATQISINVLQGDGHISDLMDDANDHHGIHDGSSDAEFDEGCLATFNICAFAFLNGTRAV